MKDIKLIKWVAAGSTCQISTREIKKNSGLMIFMIIIPITTIAINNK